MTFAKEIYEARRARLEKTMGSGLLLFLGNGVASMNYPDNNYFFRQDSTFLYFFGLDYEGLAAVIDVDNHKTIVFGDELTIDDIVWTGVQPTIAEKCAAIGVTETRPHAELATYINNAKTKKQPIHFIPPYRGHTILWLQELLGVPVNTAAGDVFVAGKPVAQPSLELVYTIANMRNHKAPEEVAEIEKAVNVTVNMHCKALEMVKPGMHEKDIAAAVMEVAFREGYCQSFPTIGTTHGETLHNHGYIHTLNDGDIFLLDAGAENEMHYAGDCTTSMPVGADFSPRQKDVYNILIDTYKTAVSMLCPGITYRECHVAAWTKIAEGLKGLGLMKGDPKEAAEAGAVAMFMPHGLGHMMGMDVHDMENYGEVYVGYPRGAQKDTRFGFRSLRLGRELEPGFVFTVEPGIYFIPDLIDQWKAAGKFTEFICYDKLDAWKNFGGMRNEEDYLITPDGYHHLGLHKPVDLSEILACKNGTFKPY
ncbi:MAG: aminopeptidase P N-terminal domain-containing protein [Bacteroidales bacterium]|nr:aminopeptidase P N-terminal domain-containing protein [Bacteroidales bacterium]